MKKHFRKRLNEERVIQPDENGKYSEKILRDYYVDNQEGWNRDKLLNLFEKIEELDDVMYELRSCIRGCTTDCYTYEKLGQLISRFGQEISDIGEEISSESEDPIIDWNYEESDEDDITESKSVNESQEEVLIDTSIYEDDPADEDIKDMLMDSFWEDIGQLDLNHENGYMIVGEIERWNGYKQIYPEFKQTLREAVEMCINRDIADFKVTLHKEEILVDALHHDGRNSFKIYALSSQGEEYFITDDNEEEPIEPGFITDHPEYFENMSK